MLQILLLIWRITLSRHTLPWEIAEPTPPGLPGLLHRYRNPPPRKRFFFAWRISA